MNRILYAEGPARAEYELTEKGKSLEPILFALKKGGETHAIKRLADRAD